MTVAIAVSIPIAAAVAVPISVSTAVPSSVTIAIAITIAILFSFSLLFGHSQLPPAPFPFLAPSNHRSPPSQPQTGPFVLFVFFVLFSVLSVFSVVIILSQSREYFGPLEHRARESIRAA